MPKMPVGPIASGTSASSTLPHTPAPLPITGAIIGWSRKWQSTMDDGPDFAPTALILMCLLSTIMPPSTQRIWMHMHMISGLLTQWHYRRDRVLHRVVSLTVTVLCHAPIHTIWPKSNAWCSLLFRKSTGVNQHAKPDALISAVDSVGDNGIVDRGS